MIEVGAEAIDVRLDHRLPCLDHAHTLHPRTAMDESKCMIELMCMAM
jgi:hypothetical protein